MYSAYQGSFASGEVTPEIYGRIDIDRYASALALCRNFFVRLRGGVSTRPGTRYLGETKDSTKKSRLVRFKYNTSQAYAMEFGNLYIRFWTTDGLILGSNDFPYEVVSPYLEADLDGLSFVQSTDMVWIFHKDYAPRILTRNDTASWTLEQMVCTNGPYQDENDGDTTITPTAETGGVQLTASAAVFEASHVGYEFRIRTRISEQEWKVTVNSGSTVTTGAIGPKKIFGDWSLVTTGRGPTVSDWWKGTIVVKRRYDGGSYQILRSYTVDKDRDLDITGTEDLDGAEYLLEYSISTNPGDSSATPVVAVSTMTLQFRSKSHTKDGSVKITAVDSATVAHGTEVRAVENEGVATSMWSAPAWGGTRGYPRCGTFFQERLIMGGSKLQPQTMWGSKIGAYTDFSVSDPVVADDSFTKTLSSREAFTIVSMVPMNDLIVLTDCTEFRVRSADGGALTPLSFEAKSQSYDGAAGMIPEIVINRVFFVQAMSREIRDFAYSWESDGYTGTIVSLLANHLFDGRTVSALCWQRFPWSVLWCVCSDGTLLGCTYLREQEVIGWHQHATQGVFESICSIPSSEQDEVFFIVKRGAKRFVELMDHRDLSDVKQLCCMDSALSYHGTPVSAFTGLSHLEGYTVKILADGSVQPDQVVTNGAVSLPHTFGDVVVGLGFEAEMQTLPIELQLQNGSTSGKNKKIPRVTARLMESRGGWYGQDFERMDELPVHLGIQSRNPLPLYSGKVDIQLAGRYEQNGTLCIKTTEPLPITVLSVAPEVVISG